MDVVVEIVETKMKRLVQITVHKKDGTKETFDNVAEWQTLDKYFWMRTRSEFMQSDKNRVTCQHHWIPNVDILKVEADDIRFFSTKQEKTDFCKTEQIKLQ